MLRRRRQPPLEPQVLDRRHIGDGEQVVAYRVVLTDDRRHENFTRSFMSRTAQGKPPRPGTPEERHPALADGISAFLTRAAAAQTARAATFRFGRFTAEVPLQAGLGITIAVWGGRGHLTIWGDPLILAGIATDIVSVEHDEGAVE